MFDWTNFQFFASASATNTVLTFAAEHDYDYFGFDDVNVSLVPPVAIAGVACSTNGFQFNWALLAGLNYRIQGSTNLASTNWLDLATVTAPGD